MPELPEEIISIGKAAALTLIGAAIGISNDVFFPSSNDGTLADIVGDAAISGLTWGAIDKFLWKKPSGYALNSAGLVAFGSAIGQTLYQYFKMYG